MKEIENMRENEGRVIGIEKYIERVKENEELYERRGVKRFELKKKNKRLGIQVRKIKIMKGKEREKKLMS